MTANLAGVAMTSLEEQYENLWQNALRAFQADKLEIDGRLVPGQIDKRKGLTLILRPDPSMAMRFNAFLDSLSQREPTQYYYPSTDFHITLLSLFTATENFTPHIARASEYIAAVDKALKEASEFQLHFRGLTASANAIMIQGFPEDATLANLREKLRQCLRDAGLGDGLDQRYVLQTAHVTVCRFRQAFRDKTSFIDWLNSYRTHDFGSARVREVHLVENDWYMSAAQVRILKTYPLNPALPK